MLRIFVSLIFTCLIAGCDNAPVPEEADRRPVKLYTVVTGGQARTYEFPAIIEASTSSDLTFDVPGKIVRLTVDQGDFVRAGTVIAQLDQTIARNQLVQAREQYEAAQDAFRRADALVGEGAIPRAVHVQRETQRDTARAELDNAREQLEKTVLRAPFSGRVARRLPEPFEYVSPQQPVVTLQTAGSAKAVVQVPSSIVANAEQRAPINAAIALDSLPDRRFAARFGSFATDATRQSLTYEATFLFDPPSGALILPGMTGTLHVELDTDDAEMPAVPLEAIVGRDEKTFVWRVDRRTGAIALRRVTVGKGAGGMLPVTAGIGRGDLIVAAGLANLEEGMKVRPYERD